MSRWKKKEEARAREIACISLEILDKFGEDTIKEARQRLCVRCQKVKCSLIPLCLDGSDCPYFKLAVQLPLQE